MLEIALLLTPDDVNTQRAWTDAIHGAATAAPERRAHYAALNADVADKLRKTGAIDFAIACYRLALRMRPDLIKAYCGLALAQQAQGDIESAAQTYRTALQLEPRHRDVPGLLSEFYPVQGEPPSLAAQ